MVQDECVRLADEAGALRVVGYLYDAEVPKAVAGVRLIFDHGDWVVTVDEDDDTIELAETTDKVLDRWQIAEASSFFPWAAAIGKTPAEDDPSNKLVAVETQLAWLREIGRASCRERV